MTKFFEGDPDGERRLEKVLELACGDVGNVIGAVQQVLSDLRGPKNRGRRIYLTNQLKRLAKNAIRNRKHTNNHIECIITPQMRSGARSHEKQISSKVPERDS